MRLENKVEEIMGTIIDRVNDKEFCRKYRNSAKDFTRQRKMGFQDIMNFILSLPKKALTFEIENYLTANSRIHIASYSKQAFSKARKKIKSEAFEALYKSIIPKIRKYNNKSWKGFKLYAIDGTTIQPPQTENNIDYYGKKYTMALALASALVDVENDITMGAELGTHKTTEGYQAERLLNDFWENYPTNNSIVIMDRGYASLRLMEQLYKHDQMFVIRSKKYCPKELDYTMQKCSVFINRSYMKHPRKMTRYSIDLGNGITEYLLTNIDNYRENNADFMKEIYAKRWGIEMKYLELKKRIHIETFSGLLEDNVQQDFFASLTFSNIACFIKKQCDIKAHAAHEHCKYAYQVNKTDLIMRLKQIYIPLLIKARGRKASLLRLFRASEKDCSLIRPERKREHRTKHTETVSPYNYKSGI